MAYVSSPSTSLPQRPATIAELQDRARDNINDWHDSGSADYYLRVVDRYRSDGKACTEQDDLESAFVAYTRASLVLLRIEKVPNILEILSEQRLYDLSVVSLSALKFSKQRNILLCCRMVRISLITCGRSSECCANAVRGGLHNLSTWTQASRRGPCK